MHCKAGRNIAEPLPCFARSVVNYTGERRNLYVTVTVSYRFSSCPQKNKTGRHTLSSNCDLKIPPSLIFWCWILFLALGRTFCATSAFTKRPPCDTRVAFLETACVRKRWGRTFLRPRRGVSIIQLRGWQRTRSALKPRTEEELLFVKVL